MGVARDDELALASHRQACDLGSSARASTVETFSTRAPSSSATSSPRWTFTVVGAKGMRSQPVLPWAVYNSKPPHQTGGRPNEL